MYNNDYHDGVSNFVIIMPPDLLAKALRFRAVCPSVHWFARTNIVTTISHVGGLSYRDETYRGYSVTSTDDLIN